MRDAACDLCQTRLGAMELNMKRFVILGTIVLGTTGALLWGEQIASQFITGRVLNIALIAHTYEAFLAIIHVGILHIVNVMLSPGRSSKVSPGLKVRALPSQ